jgi:imidazolonepropionase-like amidohydrolase
MKALLILYASVAFAQPDLAITNARLAGAGADPVTIVIHNGRISAVGAVKAPDGATTLDAGGRTVTPGLFDMHTHLRASAVNGEPADWAKNTRAYLYCGVTTVVELSSQGEMFEPLKRLIPGPHLQIASRMSPPGGHGLEGGRGEVFTLEVLTPRQAIAAVKSVLPYKPDVIKVFTDGWRYGNAPDMTSMEEATLKALVDEAHKSNIPVVTHTVTLESQDRGTRGRRCTHPRHRRRSCR